MRWALWPKVPKTWWKGRNVTPAQERQGSSGLREIKLLRHSDCKIYFGPKATWSYTGIGVRPAESRWFGLRPYHGFYMES